MVGRQLDCVSFGDAARISEVVAAVNGLAEVLMDGGHSSRRRHVKALCLGARAVLIGEPMLMDWLCCRPRPESIAAIEIPSIRYGSHAAAIGMSIVKALDSQLCVIHRERLVCENVLPQFGECGKAKSLSLSAAEGF